MHLENFGEPIRGTQAGAGNLLLGQVDNELSLLVSYLDGYGDKSALVVRANGDTRVTDDLQAYFWNITAIATFRPDPQSVFVGGSEVAISGALYIRDGSTLIGGKFGPHADTPGWVDLTKTTATTGRLPFVAFRRWQLVVPGAGTEAIALFSVAPKAGPAKATAFAAR